MLPRFKDLPIFVKIFSLVSSALVVIFCGVALYLLPAAKEALYDSRENTMEYLANSAQSQAQAMYDKMSRGELSEEEAKEHAMDAISAMRFQNGNYLWINSLEGVMLAHPLNPELVGTSVKGIKDSDGVLFFDEMIRLATTAGSGTVHYRWVKPGGTEPQPKISYITKFGPWGWIIGTGMYVDDIDAMMQDLALKSLVPFVALIVVILGLNWMVARRITRPIEDARDTALLLAQGELPDSLFRIDSKDEAGQLLMAMGEMVQFQKAVVGCATSIASGDLAVDVPVQSTKDLLGNALKQMVEQLREQIGHMAEVSNVLAGSASQISSSMGELAASSSETAASVGETMTTVEEVKQTAQMNADKARNVADAARKASSSAQEGSESMARNVGAMDTIRHRMSSINTSIATLNSDAQQIDAIVATVGDLADQSKVLAVNASIEAAKSGEEGKGFAVVAREIRQLADQSKAATAQVRDILRKIQGGMDQVTRAGQDGSEAVDNGVKQSQMAGKAITSLSGTISSSAQAAGQIAASSNEELAGVEQISQAMHSVKDASVMIQSVAEQLSGAANDLENQGYKMQSMLGKYKI